MGSTGTLRNAASGFPRCSREPEPPGGVGWGVPGGGRGPAHGSDVTRGTIPPITGTRHPAHTSLCTFSRLSGGTPRCRLPRKALRSAVAMHVTAWLSRKSEQLWAVCLPLPWRPGVAGLRAPPPEPRAHARVPVSARESQAHRGWFSCSHGASLVRLSTSGAGARRSGNHVPVPLPAPRASDTASGSRNW